MNDFQLLEIELGTLVGSSVNRPAGTLAGHAAGLPFEALVHGKLMEVFGGRVFRHYEFLNDVLSSNTGEIDRFGIFGPPSLQSLLCRGKQQMKGWSVDRPFSEKQNDTAESILIESHPFDANQGDVILLDVKTYNAAQHGQPPNIISARKLSNALALALEEGRVGFDFVYVGISWEVVGEALQCNEVSVVSLFKIQPALYVNWAAAEQIQFHPHLTEQSFDGTREEWAVQFLKAFVASLEKRNAKQIERLQRFKRIVDAY